MLNKAVAHSHGQHALQPSEASSEKIRWKKDNLTKLCSLVGIFLFCDMLKCVMPTGQEGLMM